MDSSYIATVRCGGVFSEHRKEDCWHRFGAPKYAHGVADDWNMVPDKLYVVGKSKNNVLDSKPYFAIHFLFFLLDFFDKNGFEVIFFK